MLGGLVEQVLRGTSPARPPSWCCSSLKSVFIKSVHKKTPVCHGANEDQTDSLYLLGGIPCFSEPSGPSIVSQRVRHEDSDLPLAFLQIHVSRGSSRDSSVLVSLWSLSLSWGGGLASFTPGGPSPQVSSRTRRRGGGRGQCAAVFRLRCRHCPTAKERGRERLGGWGA